MALNLRVLTIGGLISFIGALLWKIQESNWVRGVIPALSDAMSNASAVIQLVVIIGAVIVAFGLFWGRWIPAIIFGSLFALTIYVLTFL